MLECGSVRLYRRNAQRPPAPILYETLSGTSALERPEIMRVAPTSFRRTSQPLDAVSHHETLATTRRTSTSGRSPRSIGLPACDREPLAIRVPMSVTMSTMYAEFDDRRGSACHGDPHSGMSTSRSRSADPEQSAVYRRAVLAAGLGPP